MTSLESVPGAYTAPRSAWRQEAAQTRSFLALPRISEGQSPIPTAQAEAL
jgi:hypothetical protein